MLFPVAGINSNQPNHIEISLRKPMSITYLRLLRLLSLLSLLRAPMVTTQMLVPTPVVLRAKLDGCRDHGNFTSLRHFMYNWHATRTYDLHSMEALAAVHNTEGI